MDEIVSMVDLHEMVRIEVESRAGELNDFAACYDAGVLVNTRYVNDNPRLPAREVNIAVLGRIINADPHLVDDPADSIDAKLARVFARMDDIRGRQSRLPQGVLKRRNDLDALK